MIFRKAGGPRARRPAYANLFVAALLVASCAVAARAQSAAGSVAGAGEAQVFGPQKYLRTSGPKNEYTAVVSVPAWVKGPFRMHIRNGGRAGNGRLVDAISSAWITVNGVQVAGPSDFNQNVPHLDRVVTLAQLTTLKVTLASSPGSYLTIWFFGTSADRTAPALGVAEPEQGAVTSDATPAVRVRYADAAGPNEPAASGVDVSTLQVKIDDVDRTGLFAKSADEATAVIPDNLPLADGTHAIRVVVRDRAGNAGAAASQFRVDTRPPAVRITQPQADAYLKEPLVDVSGTVADDSAVVLDVNDVPATVNGNTFTARVPAGGDGRLILRATARDAAGNTGMAERAVNVDAVAPVISVSEPVEGLFTNQPKVRLAGTVVDASPTTLKLDGAPLALAGGSFTGEINLGAEGPGTFQLAATDAAGNSSTREVSVVSDVTAPRLEIASPSADSVVGSLPVVVRGLVSDRTDTTVTVNGEGASLTQGAWEATLGSPAEGDNTLTVVATDAAGNKATQSRAFVLDTAPPLVAITAPQAGTLTRLPTVNVTGTISDRSLASVTLGGASATPEAAGEGRYTFTFPDVPLADGDNPLRVVAVDKTGRSGEATIVLTQDAVAPTVAINAPEVITRSRGLRAAASAADNLAVAQLILKLGNQVIGTSAAPHLEADVNVPAGAAAGDTLTLVAEATDAAGNVTTATHALRVIADGVVVGQVLSDATGLPLAGARVRVLGGEGRATTTDARGRYALQATEARLVLVIEQEGGGGGPMTAVEREVKIESGVGTVPVDARLTTLAAPVEVGAAGATLTAGAASVSVAASAEAAGGPVGYRLTGLSPQGLPGLLPLGWSPVAALDVRADAGAAARALSATFTKLPSGALQLAAYRPSVHGWVVIARDLSAADGRLGVELPGAGAYALVVADAHGAAPQVPAAGEVLAGVELKPLPEAATSTSEVSPAILPPGGGTARGKLAVKSPTPLPSGTIVQAEVTETFSLTTGEVASQEKRSQDLILYRHGAPEGAALAAEFPIVPSRTFGAAELLRGTVHLDILAGRESVRGRTGGNEAVTLTSGSATLTLAAGSLAEDTAVTVRSTLLSTFLPSANGLVPFAEVLVDFSGNRLRLPGELSVGAENVPAGDQLLVARVERVDGIPRVVMVAGAERAGGRVVSRGVQGLPGVAEDGRYVFYRAASPLGFVAGTAEAAAAPVPGAVVETDALPFVSVTSAEGRYMVPAPAGQVRLAARVPNTSLRGTGAAAVTAGQTFETNIALAGVATTAAVTPAAGASGVSLSAQIEISTSAPLNPASVRTAELKLFKGAAADNQLVALRPVLSGSGRVLALVPQSRLEPSTLYTLQAAGLADVFGGQVAVPPVAFTTRADAPPVYDLNKLTFSFPDARGFVKLKAPAGSLPPGTTVLVVNAGNGAVVSYTADNAGAVSGELPATIDDRLLITITDPQGAVTNFERSKFVADDGRVAVGPGGGTIEGPGGVELRIPEGALEKGAVFTIEPFGPDRFPERPDLPGAHFGGGLKISSPDKPVFKKEVDLAFPKPPDAPAGAFFYVFRRLPGPNNTVGFETIDHAFVEGEGEGAKVVTASPPLSGLRNAYGEMVLDTLGGGIGFIAMPVTYEYMMWTEAVYGSGVALSGIVTGKVLRARWKPGAAEPEYEGVGGVAVTGVDEQGNTLLDRGLAVSQPDGTFALFDSKYTGGTVKVRASLGGVQRVVTAFEASPVDSRTFFTTLFQHYRNVASVNITFPAQEPAPPAPKLEIAVMREGEDGRRADAGGVIISGTPLVIGFKSNLGSGLQFKSATVRGVEYAVKADVTADPRKMDFVLQDEFRPGDAGTYTVTATALAPLGGSPVTVSSTFLVVAQGGNNNTPVENAAPEVVTPLLVPKDGEVGVPVTTVPQLVFTEPVTGVQGGVRLLDDTGSGVPVVMSGVALDEGRPVAVEDLSALDPSVSVTSVTLRPVSGLKFATSYTVKIGAGIRDLDRDQSRQPAPKSLAPRDYHFTTVEPQALGAAATPNSVANIVVFGDHAYVGQRRGSAPNGFLTVFNIADPLLPVEIKSARQGVTGELTDVTGEEECPVTNGPVVAVSSGLGFLTQAPSNLYFFDVSEPAAPKRIAAVSLSEDSGDGVIIRAAMKGRYAYTITYPKGIQVVDLQAAADIYAADETSVAKRRERSLHLVTGGQGYAQEAVVNTIPVRDEEGRLGHLFGIKADDYVHEGSSQPLVLATGSLPLVVANPQRGEIIYKPRAIADATLQYQGALTFGYALALGRVGARRVAVVVGKGTGLDPEANAVGAGPVLVVFDMADPARPRPLSFFKLSKDASDVKLADTLAVVGTAGGTAILVNLADPLRPRLAGHIEGAGGRLALTSNNLLLSSVTATGNGVGVSAFAPLSVVPVVPAVMARPDGAGTLQSAQKMKTLADFVIRPRVVPFVSGIPLQGILELRQGNRLVDAIAFGYDSKGFGAVTIPAGKLYEDEDLIAVAIASGHNLSLRSAPRRIKLGWVKLTVDSNNNSDLDDRDDEAKRKGKVFAFWESDADYEVKPNYDASDEAKLTTATKGLADYSAVRVRVNREWWAGASPGRVRIRLKPSAQQPGVPRWHLAEKLAAGKELFTDSTQELAQAARLAGASGETQCGAEVTELKGECQSSQGAIDLPKLAVGAYDYLLRCSICNEAEDPASHKMIQVEYQSSPTAEWQVIEEAKADVRPLKHWLSMYSARQQEVTERPMRNFEVMADTNWPTRVPDKAQKVTALVHGYNVDYSGAIEYFKTYFKRLYWAGHPVMRRQGSDWRQEEEAPGFAFESAHTVGLSWPGNIGAGLGPTLRFPGAEFRSLQAGVPMAKFFRSIYDEKPGRSINVIGHSLGNMVVNSALMRPEMGPGRVIDKYVMYDAAVAAEAFDVPGREKELFAPLAFKQRALEFFISNPVLKLAFEIIEPNWNGVRPGGEIPDYPLTERGPWKGYFAKNLDRAEYYNVFNRTDQVLQVVWTSMGMVVKPLLSTAGGDIAEVEAQIQSAWRGQGLQSDEDLWGDGQLHTNTLIQWKELSYWFWSKTLAAGAGEIPSIGSRNYEFTHLGLSNLPVFDGDTSYLDTHSYLTARRFSKVYTGHLELRGIFRKPFNPSPGPTAPAP